MLIENKEALKLQERFKEELMTGNDWVTYNTIQSLHSATDFFSFVTKDEAREFCSNNISDHDRFVSLPLAYVSEELSRALRSAELSNNNPSLPITLQLDISFQNNHTYKSNIMNQKNFEYLRDQVKFTGFGEGLENELKEKMQKQTPEFTLFHNAKFGNDIAAASLHFKRSEQSDMYFFNSYHLNLKQENANDTIKQTFYNNKGNNITLKEAYNLMNGRAVNKDLTNKEGQFYNAWLQMDFKQAENNGNYRMKQFHQNYGFDLQKVLEKHPIKELTNEQDKTRLIDSLRKGNRQSVTFIHNNSEQKCFIEANPQFKTINVYDSNMQRLNTKLGQNEQQKQGQSNSVKQDSKKENQSLGTADDGPEIPNTAKKRTRRKSQSVS